MIVAAATLLLTACNKNSQPTTAEALETAEDSVAVVDEPLENEEVTRLTDIINTVATSLDSIQIQEGLLYKMDEGTPKDQVVARLKAFQDLLKRKQGQIKQLTSENKSSKLAMANLQKTMDFLGKQLEEKSAYIAKLQDLMEKKDASISSLRYNLDRLTAESEYLQDQNYEQDKMLNQAFYIVGDKEELKELGLLAGGGLSKKRANYANIDQSKFKKVDVRGFEQLVIESKSPKLLTEKPESSYTLTKNDDGTTTLQITDAKAFWAASPYLIIQK